MKLGIDFGTSYSTPCINYLGTNTILLPAGLYAIPSVLYYNQKSGVIIGDEALEFGIAKEANNLVREIKLDLKNEFYLDGKKFTSRQIVSNILNYIKLVAIDIAKSKLIDDGNIEGVVISVPAAFENNEKELIKSAAQDVGLNVLGLIKEPVAASLAYFNQSLEDNTKILVYDLGGGTCDIALVEANSKLDEKFNVIDSDMIRIGGKDWDEKISEYIFQELEKQTGINYRNKDGLKEKVKRAAIYVKHSLSQKNLGKPKEKAIARIEIEGRLYNIEISKLMFNELTFDLANKTINLAKEVAKRNNMDFSKIILVGGSSNMPQIQNLLKDSFEGSEVVIFEPEHAIAQGAGIFANSIQTKRIVKDIASYSYGTDCCKLVDDKKQYYMSNLILKGQSLPVKKVTKFLTIKDNQKAVGLDIFENLSLESKYDIEKNQFKPILEVSFPLPEGAKKGYEILCETTLTEDGLLTVFAQDKDGKTISANTKIRF